MNETSSNNKDEQTRLFSNTVWVGIVVAVFVFLGAVSPRNSRSQRAARSAATTSVTYASQNPTVAEKVAVIDNGINSNAGSERVQRTLDQLSYRFSDSPQMMASRAMAAQKILRREGVHRSLSDILSDIERISAEGTAGASYSEVLAAYATLAGN